MHSHFNSVTFGQLVVCCDRLVFRMDIWMICIDVLRLVSWIDAVVVGLLPLVEIDVEMETRLKT